MAQGERTERWRDLSGQVGAEMAAWRAEHPRATWREIEAALEERWRTVRAQLLKEAAEASVAADLKEARAVGETVACPHCGQALRERGRPRRQVTTEGQQVIALERSYGVCPACGTGHFPPG
jgi:sRNA-binding protein